VSRFKQDRSGALPDALSIVRAGFQADANHRLATDRRRVLHLTADPLAPDKRLARAS
jgi:hypothetical protein